VEDVSDLWHDVRLRLSVDDGVQINVGDGGDDRVVDVDDGMMNGLPLAAPAVEPTMQHQKTRSRQCFFMFRCFAIIFLGAEDDLCFSYVTCRW